MKFFRFIFLVSGFFIFCACDNLHFTDKDFVLTETKSSKEFNLKFSKEETTILSKDFELLENTVIKNKKVIFNMIKIKTNEHDLTIIADEFISNHSIIQNFQEKQTAKKEEEGKSGGHVFIKTEIAKGNLSLILNGENAGSVSKRVLSLEELASLSGRNGENGSNALYMDSCDVLFIPVLKIPLNSSCKTVCAVDPKRGKDGENGRRGYTGFKGKKGGDTGSFYMEAFNSSEFYLTEIKKSAGIGGKGGKGSHGGLGGRRGKNGLDIEALCSSENLLMAKEGKEGERGLFGKNGENGMKGMVCVETIKANKSNPRNKKLKASCLENKNCRDVFIQKQESTLKEENRRIICY